MMSSSVTSHPSASSCQHHHCLLHHSPRKLCPRCHSHPASSPTGPGTILLSASMNLLTEEGSCHMVFCVWFISLSMLFSRFTHAEAYMSKYSSFKSLNSIYCANSLCTFITNGHFNWNGKILSEAKN